jgi:hypothetical protein
MRTEEKQQKGKISRYSEITGRWPIPKWVKKRNVWGKIRAAWKTSMNRGHYY